MAIEQRAGRTTPPIVEVTRHPPFTRLDERGRGTVEDFDRERMGIAAKE